MAELAEDYMAELAEHYDARQDAVNECAPDVAHKLGFDAANAVMVLLLMPATIHQGTHILPPRLHAEAIRRLANDLLQDVPDALAIQTASDQLHEQNQILARVWDEQFRHVAHDAGLEVKPRPRELTPLTVEWKAVHARTEATEPFRLGLADAVLAGEHLTRALIAWARRHWPGEVQITDSKVSKASGLTTLPPSQLEEVSWAANHVADHDLGRAIMLKHLDGAWLTNTNEGFKYYPGVHCQVIYKPNELFSEAWYSEAREQTLEALDRRLLQMRSELTADVIDILFHHWRTYPYPKDQSKATITLSQICEYRGKQSQQLENLRDVWEAMRDARSIRLSGDGTDAALFDMDAVAGTQRRLWAVEEPPTPDVGYIYSPGYFLSKAIEQNPIYVAPYMRRVWELDPLRHSTAKRLARYLRSEWRMNTEKYLRASGDPASRYRTWASILNDAGVVPAEWQKKKPTRFIKDISRALETLYDLSAIAECDTSIYHPEDLRLIEKLPARGTFSTFMALRVCIDPAADVREALEPSHIKRIARTARLAALPEPKKGKKKAVKS